MLTYYIDIDSGNSSNNGLSPSTPATDYRSLDLSAGDTVLSNAVTLSVISSIQ